ncbi:uncharacterized protein METZ01_LOCUS159538, partial [marine metagenome]
AVSNTIETADGYERLTQSGLVSAPGIVNGIDPGHIGDPVTLYHAGYVDLRQADGTFAGKARQQFGPGVYTASDAFTTIDGWARPRRGADGIQTGQPGYLHTLKWTGDESPQILDMEEPLPDDLIDLALDHLFDLNRFIEAADPVKERPSTPEEYESFGQDMDWTFDEYRIHLKDELVARINNTIERIRRSQEQGRPQRTGREILGPNGGLADIFREIDITPDGIIDLTGNPDGWVKPAVVDRMRTKLNNDLVEAGYDVLRAIDVRREEFMFLDPSKVEFVDSAKISSVDPFGTDGGHHLRQILYEESGYASTRGGRMTNPLIVDRGYAIHHADMRFGEERSISILPENRTYNQTLTNPDLYQYEVGTVKKVGSRRDQYEVTLNDGTKFRRSKLREVYEELERLKPQPNDGNIRAQSYEDLALERGNIIYRWRQRSRLPDDAENLNRIVEEMERRDSGLASERSEGAGAQLGDTPAVDEAQVAALNKQIDSLRTSRMQQQIDAIEAAKEAGDNKAIYRHTKLLREIQEEEAELREQLGEAMGVGRVRRGYKSSRTMHDWNQDWDITRARTEATLDGIAAGLETELAKGKPDKKRIGELKTQHMGAIQDAQRAGLASQRSGRPWMSPERDRANKKFWDPSTFDRPRGFGIDRDEQGFPIRPADPSRPEQYVRGFASARDDSRSTSQRVRTAVTERTAAPEGLASRRSDTRQIEELTARYISGSPRLEDTNDGEIWEALGGANMS